MAQKHTIKILRGETSKKILSISPCELVQGPHLRLPLLVERLHSQPPCELVVALELVVWPSSLKTRRSKNKSSSFLLGTDLTTSGVRM